MKAKLFVIITFSIAILLISCNAEREDFQGERYGSINSGKIKVLCDESILGLMDSTFKMYLNAYPKIELELEAAHARRAMALLLSGDVDAVVVARPFLKDEDSLMKSYDVIRPEMLIASDALVFYTKKDFPIDTLNHEQLVEVLSGKSSLTKYFPVLAAEPTFVCNSTNSSEFANIQNLVLKENALNKYFTTFSSSDSVRNYVLNNSNTIGVGYLSQIHSDTTLKALKIGFIKPDGNRVFPQLVHQGFIVQGKYPYIPKIRVYIREDNKSAQFFWFASFLSKEAVVQKYMLDMGIVPEYAKIKLRKE